MANYYDPNKYSLLKEMQGLETSYGKAPQAVQTETAASSAPMFDSKTTASMASGMQSGGLSGALMSGGVMSGNPYMIGGGLILSELEAKKKAEAEAERQNIENEKARRANVQNVLSQMSASKFGI